ncbi:hypothetical protein ACSXC5_17610 (plasmid) [Clostridium perfringens]|uniref:Uncharacterized protein n=1 Tax=Clostridium perfringens TaxID=1502 RepID=A0A0N7BVR3_CLOPF|nr:hypothetical protein [Clostridium perfringens]AKF16689.1 hypothetical protein [Clostridium perfringens]ALD82602.1 hypothetical protein JFP838_pB0071 [Clostridium perfringens]
MDYTSFSKDIENSEVRFYFDSIFKKITSAISNQEISDELYYWANCLFQKYKIQFYSIMKLTDNFTNDLENKYEYFDIVSIHTLIRSCYETFLLFDYIYLKSKSLDEQHLKLLLYKYNGFKDQLHIVIKNSDKYNKIKVDIKKTKSEIYKNNFFMNLDDKTKNKLLKSWKPSWNEIAKSTIMSNWNSRKQYNLLCQHAHGSFASLLLIDYYYRNLGEYDFNAINCQLYEITTLFFDGILRIFNIDFNILSEPEIGLLQEFLHMSTLEQNEFSKTEK